MLVWYSRTMQLRRRKSFVTQMIRKKQTYSLEKSFVRLYRLHYNRNNRRRFLKKIFSICFSRKLFCGWRRFSKNHRLRKFKSKIVCVSRLKSIMHLFLRVLHQTCVKKRPQSQKRNVGHTKYPVVNSSVHTPSTASAAAVLSTRRNVSFRGVNSASQRIKSVSIADVSNSSRQHQVHSLSTSQFSGFAGPPRYHDVLSATTSLRDSLHLNARNKTLFGVENNVHDNHRGRQLTSTGASISSLVSTHRFHDEETAAVIRRLVSSGCKPSALKNISAPGTQLSDVSVVDNSIWHQARSYQKWRKWHLANQAVSSVLSILHRYSASV